MQRAMYLMICTWWSVRRDLIVWTQTNVRDAALYSAVWAFVKRWWGITFGRRGKAFGWRSIWSSLRRGLECNTLWWWAECQGTFAIAIVVDVSRGLFQHFIASHSLSGASWSGGTGRSQAVFTCKGSSVITRKAHPFSVLRWITQVHSLAIITGFHFSELIEPILGSALSDVSFSASQPFPHVHVFVTRSEWVDVTLRGT